MRWLSLVVFLSLWFGGAAWAETKNAIVPLPDLGTGPVALRFVHAVNPNLPRLSDTELQRLLSFARGTVKQHFAIDIEFTRTGG